MKMNNKLISFIILTLIFLAGSRQLSYSADFKLILLTANKGLRISENSGKSWKDFNAGLPDKFTPEKFYADDPGNFYLITRKSGIYKFNPDKNNWEDINSPEFLEPALNAKTGNYRRISAFASDKDGRRGSIALATMQSVFRKDTGGRWDRVSVRKRDEYFTAIGLNKNSLYLGTSCNGIFRTKQTGSISISSGLPKEAYSKDYSFYEEIAAIEFDAKDPGIIYAGTNFGGGVYMSKDNGRSWYSLSFPASEARYDIFGMSMLNNSLFVSAGPGLFRMDENHKWHTLSIPDILSLGRDPENLSIMIIDKTGKYPPLFYRFNSYSIKRKDDPAGKAELIKAIYANSYSLNKNLPYYIETIKKCGFNAIVIDVKDDWGDICFPSANKTALELKAVKNYIKIKQTLEQLKKSGIWSIGRIVVFKDKRLYNGYNFKYAIFDSAGNAPWKGNPREYWNDPYSSFVRNYNIEIAKEAENLGFDEIQFDYIRFPSDGLIERCYYRHKNNNDIYKSEILACFLEEAKSRIKVPVSVDIYGFAAWFRLGYLIGQDAERFSEIADVICPMVYPSHYGRNFYLSAPAAARPYRIVLENSLRAAKIMMGNTVMRPYLQAFNLLSPTWSPDYIRSQIKAAAESGGGGFTFWNASGNYDMVRKAFP